MNRKEQINNIFSLFKKHNPKPTTELKYNSDYELLIAVVLSAQATDVSVNKATDKLFLKANTPKKIVAMGLLQLESYIKSIGLYKSKAKNIITLSEILIEKYKSEVPNSYEELISLPGVGRKTANVILNTLFGKPTIAVDTHIFRVSNRLGFAKGKTPLEVEEKLQKVIPKKYKHDAHHWLILHGRYVCKARVPDCENCFINKYCDYYKKLMSER
ncbi:MAG TPA: endonuclease III [Burkholderiales bacterium]|nr:endonuclease III [Burkholderiales bacterium]